MIELISQALFSGALAGGYYALVALGLALVFGTTKVINLAHGEMVLLAAYVAFTAESKLGLNPVLAIPLAVAATIVVSLIIANLIGRISKDRELNSLILTFGIGIVLTNLILMIWSADIRSTSLPWFNDGVLVANTVFTTQGQILACAMGVTLAAGLWWWLAHSWNGRALRAIASNRNAAMLMAVNPKRVEMLSFIVAGLMAGVAGVAIYTVTVIQPPLGTSLTIKAFIITVLAGMGSIPGVIAGALLIGIAEGLTATLANSALQELVGMVLFLVVLLVRPSGLFGSRGRVGWKYALSILGAVFAYVAVPLLLSGNDYVMSLLIAALTVAGIALPWALLGNLGGMVSFGHAAFFGVGSYTSVLLVRAWGIDPFLGIVLGGIGAAVASIATMPALKLRGPYFALAILAYAEIFRILANQATWLTGGAAGILRIPQFTPWFGIPFNTKPGAYVVILTLVLIAMAIYQGIRSSAWGLALKAMGGTEDATRVIGVPSTYLKAAMLAVSAALTGMVGAYNAHVIGFLEPDYAFGGVWSVAPIVAAIFGGYRTVSGPVIGALVVYLLDQLVFKSLLPTGHLVMYGVLLVVVILASPSGLLPAVTRLVKGKAHAAG